MLFSSAIFLLLHRLLVAFTALALESVKIEFYVIKKKHTAAFIIIFIILNYSLLLNYSSYIMIYI